MAAKLCPICESGHLHHHSEMIEVEFMGHKAMRPSHYSVCDSCGSEQATAADLRHNKRNTIAFRKTVMKLLTGTEVKTLRIEWGLTQKQAALVFGGGSVAFAKYEADDVIQSEAMDKLLRMAKKFPNVLRELKENAGIVESKPQLVRIVNSVTNDLHMAIEQHVLKYQDFSNISRLRVYEETTLTCTRKLPKKAAVKELYYEQRDALYA